MECLSRNWNWCGCNLQPREARVLAASAVVAWAFWSESKSSHTSSLSAPSMSVKFGKAASLVSALGPVIRFSVETLGSGHFSLSSASLAVVILSSLQLVSSTNFSTSFLLACLK